MSEVSLRAAYGAYREFRASNTLADLCKSVVKGQAKYGYHVTHIYSFVDAQDEVQLFYCRDGNHEDLLTSPHVARHTLLWKEEAADAPPRIDYLRARPNYLLCAYAQFLHEEGVDDNALAALGLPTSRYPRSADDVDDDLPLVARLNARPWWQAKGVAICLVGALIPVAGVAFALTRPDPEPRPRTNTYATGLSAVEPRLDPAKATATAPATYHVRFESTRGVFVATITRAWAPLAADRFFNLVRAGFYDDATFFRVIPGFGVQFGLSGTPRTNAAWQEARIADDPARASNTRGRLSFVSAGPSTRTTQIFINTGNNLHLDSMGLAPFGEITSGMNVVERLFGEYGEAPKQERILTEGDAYLMAEFPRLDFIKRAEVVENAP
jgi:peptidyl-prolyl cis-trans isomerase A (cyclophilin A)